MVLKSNKLKFFQTCRICNKKFKIYKHKLKEGRGKYCSRVCFIESTIGRSAWNKGKTFNRVISNCEICNKKINVVKSYRQKMGKRFCSNECRNYFFSQMPQYKNCIVCIKIFKDRMTGNKIYCSKKCYWENLKKIHPKRKGNNYVWINVDGKRIYKHRYLMQQIKSLPMENYKTKIRN